MSESSKKKTVSADEIEKTITVVSSNNKIPAEQQELLVFILKTFLLLTQMLNSKKVTVSNLRKLLFGPKTEKKSKKRGVRSKKKKKKKNTGSDNTEKVYIEHKGLKAGDRCPECDKGRLYPENDQKETLYKGQSPFIKTIFIYAVLRCNFCGEYYRAEETEQVRKTKASGVSNLALLRYRMGLPHYRIEDIGSLYGTSFPTSSQWDLLNENAYNFLPVYNAMIKTAGNAELLYGDDTYIKILENDPIIINGKVRKRIHTSGFLCKTSNKSIVLFFTGYKNAGENLESLLEYRNVNLPPPVFMCDASSSNIPDDKYKVNTAFCNAHNRRKYIALLEFYPNECSVVIECYRRIYLIDRKSKEKNLSPEERLQVHKKYSTRYVKLMYRWINRILKFKHPENISGLGKAIKYSLKNKKYLTKFIKLPGCPLDNNVVEQKLKNAIIHRKNSLFYKTQHGADVGDMYMSIINTCMENNANVMEYLNQIQLNYKIVKKNPMQWMPWNYKENLK